MDGTGWTPSATLVNVVLAVQVGLGFFGLWLMTRLGRRRHPFEIVERRCARGNHVRMYGEDTCMCGKVEYRTC